MFDDEAWKKANNVLAEILAGHASDPPGQTFYTHRLNTNGERMRDADGLFLYVCNRYFKCYNHQEHPPRIVFTHPVCT